MKTITIIILLLGFQKATAGIRNEEGLTPLHSGNPDVVYRIASCGATRLHFSGTGQLHFCGATQLHLSGSTS